jgi:hypothetical protein
MSLFEKLRKLEHGHLLEVAGMCAGFMALILIAVFISQGGMAKVNNFLAVNHIAPGSQTAVNWGCVFGYSCDSSSYQFVFYLQGNGYTNSTPAYAPGSQVALNWAAYAVFSGTPAGVCAPSKGGAGDCSITPTVGTFSPTGAQSGTFYVYPTVTTTYTLYSQFASVNGYGTTAVTVNVAPLTPTCSLAPPTQSVALPTSPSITYSTTNATAVSYAVDGVARGAPAGNPFVPTGATTIGSHNVIMTVSGPGGSATCGSSGNVVVSPQPATSCTLSPASQNIVSAQSASFTYANPNANTTTYTVDGGAPVTVTGGSFSVPPGLPVGTHSVQLQVANTTNSSTCGTAGNVLVTTAPLPAVTITAGGASSVTINPNATTDLAWSASGATPGTASITAPSNSAAVTNLGSISGTVSVNAYASYIVTGGYVYMMGGYNTAWTNTLSRVLIADGDISTTGGWTPLGTVTAGGVANKVGTSATKPLLLNGTVYTFGGITPTGYSWNICSIPVANLGTASGWSCPATLPPLPTMSQAFVPPLVIGDYIYLIGGLNGSYGRSLASVARAPVSSPTSWTVYPDVLPVAVYGPQVIMGNYVYIFGGGLAGAGYGSTIYRALITSDLTSPSSWTVGGSIPGPLAGAEVAVDPGYVYLIGGNSSATALSSTVYKIARGTLAAGGVVAASWTSAGTLPVAESNISATLYIGDKLYIMGGYSLTNAYVNKIYGAPFNAGYAYTTPFKAPWETDGSRNTATTWPITVPSVAYTLSATNSGGTNTAIATVNKPDLCTNAPFTGVQNPLPNGVTAAGATCSCTVVGAIWDGSSCGASLPILSGFSGPLRVRSGNTATLSYTVVNPPATCSITANGAPMATISPVSGVPGTVDTNAITSNTVFTLACAGVSRSVSVGITPVFQEQ